MEFIATPQIVVFNISGVAINSMKIALIFEADVQPAVMTSKSDRSVHMEAG